MQVLSGTILLKSSCDYYSTAYLSVILILKAKKLINFQNEMTRVFYLQKETLGRKIGKCFVMYINILICVLKFCNVY